MTEQTGTREYDTVSFKSKWKNINFLNNGGLVISCGLTVITLFITWIFFISVYRSKIDELLADISGNGFNINFVGLSLSMYGFMLLFVAIVVIYIVFFKKHDVITFSITIASVIVGGLLLLLMIIFGGIANAGFQSYIANNGGSNILFFVIPWIFTIIFVGSTIGFACKLMIDGKPKKSKSVFLNQKSVIKQEQLEVNHDVHAIVDISNNSQSIAMEINEPLPEEVASESLPLPSTVQPIPTIIKHPMRKNDDEPDFQSLENIRLQVQPGATPAILQELSSSEDMESKIEKELNEHDSKLQFNSEPIAIKIKEQVITELPDNKRVIIGVTEMPILRAEISQPLYEDKTIIYSKDVTLDMYKESPELVDSTQPHVQNDGLSLEPLPPLVTDSSSVINSPPSIISTNELPEPIPIETHDDVNLKIFSSNTPSSNAQQEHPDGTFVQNVYPQKAPIQGVPPPPLPTPIKPELPVISNILVAPVLTAEISQPINPQPPLPPELPKKPSAPLKVWTNEQIDRAWERGLVVPSYEPEAYRGDYAGALMFKGSFVANPNVEENNNIRSYSWTIVYQRPLAVGGNEEPSNLWPLNCLNALAKGQDYPKWKTTITFNGTENVLKNNRWKGKRKIPKIKT